MLNLMLTSFAAALIRRAVGQRVNLTLFAFLPAASVDDDGCHGSAAGWTVVVVDANITLEVPGHSQSGITLEVPACLVIGQPVSDGRLIYSSHASKLRIHLEHVRGPFDIGLTEHTIGHLLIHYQGHTCPTKKPQCNNGK